MTTELESEDSAELTYKTPHGYYSDSLRIPTPKAKLAATQALMDAFKLQKFDAETLVSAAADVSTIKEAVKKVRQARRGSISVSYIELDVVTWRILPSPENIRFEDSRVRSGTQGERFSSLSGGLPVLVFKGSSSSVLAERLDREADVIYQANEHAATIADRGIENPGLLSIARIETPDRETVGVLDATDGFGRAVGAHRTLAISASDVLWKFTNEAQSMALRRDLMQSRRNPHDSEDLIGLHLTEDDRGRLRASVMVRAQVIVGYSSLDESTTNRKSFDQIRRTLVGHIHIEPPKPFSLGTQYAIKATAAVQALDVNDALPVVGEFEPAEIAAVFLGNSEVVRKSPTNLHDGRNALLPDEVFVLGLEAMRGREKSGHRRARLINAAIRELTGQTPTRTDRSMIAADLALRLGELASGNPAGDQTIESRRSAIDRAIRGKTFDDIRLIRNSVEDLLDAALMEIREDLDFTEPRPHCAALAGLGLYHMAGVQGRRLLERATKKDSASGSYISEPNVVIDALAGKVRGLKQLAQIILDGRSGRTPQMLPENQEPADIIFAGADLATAGSIREAAGMASSLDVPVTPSTKLLVQIGELKKHIREFKDRIEAIESIEKSELSEDHVPLIEERGAALGDEIALMQSGVYKLQKWNEIVVRLAATAIRESNAADLEALDFAVE